MKVTIKATNFQITPAITKLIEEKIGTLDKLIPHIDSTLQAWVEVGIVTGHHQKGDIYRAEANLQLPGWLVRSEAEREDLRLAIIEVKDKLQRELKQYKDKHQAIDKKRNQFVKVLIRLSPLAWFKRAKGERIRDEGT